MRQNVFIFYAYMLQNKNYRYINIHNLLKDKKYITVQSYE